ncbi:MEDOS 2 [Hibiscus trionum]|uniref:MEDOS 2 n=1 Tax=Hibiscus trionum TaxID=183268 RepID=A0A9W7GWP4_HIBTR|nr:MEDOS 2 [Hibiscus trionum]
MLRFIFYLHLLLCVNSAGGSAPYTPTDYILLDCGASSSSWNTQAEDGRKWFTDERSKFAASNSESASFASTASRQDHSVTQVPYMTARVFRDQFTYSFPVSPGLKFLRFYFYPVQYSSFDGTTSFFSVTANNHLLLNNFSASLTLSVEDGQPASLIKEFMVPCFETEKLNVSFSPSPNTWAFVNGIELVSMPKNMYVNHQENSLTLVGYKVPFDIPDATAFETVFRLNVGGKTVGNVDDTGMFRTWLDDSDYIFGGAVGNTPSRGKNVTIKYSEDTPAYIAPAIIYTTSRTMVVDPEINMNFNLTWNFSVDAGFTYLLRLHFCETQLEVTEEGQRVFDIFINNQTAEHSADVIHWSGGNSIPVYRDYALIVPTEAQSKQTLWLALHPSKDVGSKFADAILNGLEIFRLSKSDGSLAVPNPQPEPAPSPTLPSVGRKKKKTSVSPVMVITITVFSALLALCLIICFLIYKRKVKRVKDSAVSVQKSSWGQLPCPSNSTCATSVSLLPSDLCRRFSIIELKEATLNFDDQFIIGSGGFGNVYRGRIDGGSTTVAIKRLDSSSRQGFREFQTELELLSKLRHVNLVSLIGFCDDHGEMILVYEYMHRGTLRDHLYKTKNPPLPWKRRLEICIGAARGLQYLHAGVKHPIIHRDIKSTNILLDENWVAKVSDFGLSRLGPLFQSHVTTVVKGSVGYVDPEYYRRQQLTEKSDVYSFGVVLFEVLCARQSMIPGLPKDQVNLARWARICYARGTLENIVDPNLMGDISPLCLQKFGALAESCVRDEGTARPMMNDVVWGLEFALQVQEATQRDMDMDTGGDEATVMSSSQTSSLVSKGAAGGGTTTSTEDDNEELFSVSGGKVSESRSTISSVGRSDGDRIKSESVFSEFKNDNGR